MIKSELITQLAKRYPALQKEVVESCVNQLLERMSNALSQGQRIEIRGFGSFSLHFRPPRRAHNPKTGARVLTEAKYAPHFKPGKELRDRVNESRLHHPIQVDTDEEHEE
ncbi:MAG: integration host factor subunit beta [Gammaproteobacteria bacterium RIFCSPHIGHO2_12_FULL_45_9]|nr:MAG: integration host factor subunit beta [Gammaproteobacteria bacterium RIFCSPHIGHO2_12_FULL_45_9]